MKTTPNSLTFKTLCLFLGLNSCEQQKKLTLETPDQKALYAMGSMYANQVTQMGLSEGEVKILAQGLIDYSINSKNKIQNAASEAEVRNFWEKKTQQVVAFRKKEGEQFIEKFISGGGQKLTTGLAYKIIKPGNDKKPTTNDTVELHYHGTLPNGEVFDSSIDRKEQMTISLSSVIPGWQQGVPLIGEGGEIELVIPPDLAYGEAGAPPKVPGGATLMFKVELAKVLGPQTEAPAQQQNTP